jgi:hypothetical protein
MDVYLLPDLQLVILIEGLDGINIKVINYSKSILISKTNKL